jgi:hypothetical protein
MPNPRTSSSRGSVAGTQSVLALSHYGIADWSRAACRRWAA